MAWYKIPVTFNLRWTDAKYKNLPDGKLVKYPKTHAPSAQINYSYPFIKRTSYISHML